MVRTAESATFVKARNHITLTRLAGLNHRLGIGMGTLLRLWGDTQIVDMRRRFIGGTGLFPRRGALRGSFTYSLDGKPGGDREMSIHSIGTSAVTRTGQQYATTQEGYPNPGQPTIIRQKYKRWLTVPTKENVGALGLPKYFSAAALRAQGRTRRVGMVIEVKEGSEWVPMWTLRKFVKIPPRLRFHDSFLDRKKQRGPQLGRVVNEAIRGG